MRTLLIDIETAPANAWIWRTGKVTVTDKQVVKPGRTLCFAAKWLGEDDVLFRSEWQHGFRSMCESAHALLEEADAVIHFYGSMFDIPTLQREFIVLGMTPPKPYHQIDLHHTVRKQMKLESNKLDYVCRRLGIGAKVQHKGFSLWEGVMDGCSSDCDMMEEYNRQDVVLLEPLYKRLLPWINNHPNVALYAEGDNDVLVEGNEALRPACTSCGSTNLESRGWKHTKTQVYKQYRCKDCGSWHRSRTTVIPASNRSMVLTQSAIN